jgi:FAD/FMN-containing dehydrogenase
MTTQSLQERISGTVLHRGDPDYEQARHAPGWNELKPERYPDLIVQVASEDDVIEAVNFAREQHMKIGIRGGGHSWCAAALQEGGILLDLSRLNKVEIDPEARVATAEPVVTNRYVAKQLAKYGLAFPVGHCPCVPLSGFILNGGLGWNGGEWGISCFSLLSLDIGTADGNLVTASETENTELLWAARGAGPGFFGVATKYRLRLYPLPKAITTSTLTYKLERLPEVVEWATQTVNTLPANVEFTLYLASAPPSVADRCEKICVLSATAFADSDEEAVEALAALATCPLEDCLIKDLHASTPFEVLFDNADRFWPEGKRYAVDTMWYSSPPLEVLTIVQEHFATVPSAHSMILCPILPSPTDATPLPDAAFSMVAPGYVACYSIWEEAGQDEVNIEWLRTLMRALEPLAGGCYVGESDIAANPSQVVNSYASSNWERLQALREKYDPNGVFHSYMGVQ